MVDAGDDVELEFAGARGGLEGASIDLDLLDTGAVEGTQRGEDAGFLAGAAGAVDEEMGEVGGGGLGGLLMVQSVGAFGRCSYE